MIIYTKKETERLQYICTHIFKRILGIEFELCTNIHHFNNFDGYKLNYSDVLMENVFSIHSHNLLFEDDIHLQNVAFSEYNNIPICFSVQAATSALPFDVFAACFLFLSRYEEYLPHTKDKHQRYDVSNSLAYKHDFLHLAVVDRWIQLFADELQKKYPNISFSERSFSFTPTYDIDLAYAYKHKGFLLNTAGFARSLLKLDFKSVKKRANVLFGKTLDPYETFDYLSSLHQKYGLNPCYFFLVAKKRSKYDKNTRTNNKNFQNLIKTLSQKSDIGLHTSYYVMDKTQNINSELACFQNILKKPAIKNRHHYLRFSLPISYQLLASKGIKEEYSMGYVHNVGFRAGTCNPFFFFDLQKNKTTDMLVYPLLFMENALLEKDASQTIEYLKPFIEETRQYKGTLVSLFHNQSFGDEGNEQKWKEVYEELLKIIG